MGVRPAIDSAAMTPCVNATWASGSLPVTSPYRVNAGHVRAHAAVHLDEAAVGLDALLLEAYSIRIGLDSNAEQDLVALELLFSATRLEFDRRARSGSIYALDHCARGELDALLPECPLEFERNVLVFFGHEVRQNFEQHDLDPVGVEVVGELHTYRARPHDTDGGRLVPQFEGLPTRDYRVAVDFQVRQSSRPRSGGDHDVIGDQRGATLDLYERGASEHALAPKQLDVVLPEQEPDAASESGRHFAAPVNRLAHVGLEIVKRQAPFSGVFQLADQLGILEERL